MRLIDADALIRKMQKVATEAWKMRLKSDVHSIWHQAIDLIKNAPTIETCEDAISREDALTVAYAYCPDDDGSCTKADRDLRELLDDLEALPSVAPTIPKCRQ